MRYASIAAIWFAVAATMAGVAFGSPENVPVVALPIAVAAAVGTIAVTRGTGDGA